MTLRDDLKTRDAGPAHFEIVSADVFRSGLPALLRRNAERGESLIVRPVASNLIQVDDCNRAMLGRLLPFSFLTFETSPENYQAWLALPADIPKPERDRVRARLLRAVDGADKGASGAMRWPGSINHKPGRDGFRVRLVSTSRGRVSTVKELEAAGLLAPELPEPQAPAQRPRTSGPRSWPDYERCVREAPRKGAGSPDRSVADKNWALLAVGRGWSASEVESKLLELSDKARKRPGYARSTASYAASVSVV